MKKTNLQKVATYVAVLGLVLLTVGTAYSLFKYVGTGSTENTITSGDSITFLYEEKAQQGNGISITDAMPISDTDGIAGPAFNFEISSKNTGNSAIPYEIDVRQKPGTDDIGGIVKLYLTKVDNSGNETQVILEKFSYLDDAQHNNHGEKRLTLEQVPAHTNNYLQKYRLRMWIDEDADFSGGVYNNKTFAVTVNVYSGGSVVQSSGVEIPETAVSSVVLDATTLQPTELNGSHYEYTYSSTVRNAELVVTPLQQAASVQLGKTDSTYETLVAMNDSKGIQRMSSTPSMTSNFHIKLHDGDNYYIAVVTNGNRTRTLTFKLTVPSNTPSSNRLADMIIADNTVITNTDPVVSALDNTNGVYNGLYQSTATNSGDSTYYFYGTPTNNYVSYAGNIWRVVRINEDGTVRIILDEKINSTGYAINNIDNDNAYSVLSAQNNFDKGDNTDPDYTTKYNTILSAISEYAYYTSNDVPYNYRYSNSNHPLVKDILQTWYQTNIASSNNYSKWIAHKSGNYFCEALHLRGDYTYPNTFTPVGKGVDMMSLPFGYSQTTFTCTQDMFNHQYVDSNVGLLTDYEYLNAVGDTAYSGSDQHISSYLDKSYDWWLSNPAGTSVYYFDGEHYAGTAEDYVMMSASPNELKYVRPVVNLKAATTATKNGSGVYVID